MRKILLGAVVTLIVIFSIYYVVKRYRDSDRLVADTALIQEQISNVGKLVVTEGHFSQVFTYEDSKKFYLDVLSAKKKAIIIINADVTIAYDLRQLETVVDQENKIINIKYIPEPEVKINPQIDFYDIEQDYLNQFRAEDYNKIRQRTNKIVGDKIKSSGIKENARNRLITELSNIYILTRSLGWKLQYKNEEIASPQSIEHLL
ncbi:MAG: hypothetical protein CL868_16980 [Cytophagaceae bacterium]|nr:hypothetical protein [Cytophagaceae bacterium]|tara:strand:- start:8531 stop:9142 length:612 start_codon:yes stop_codon:yes gene_type:complete